MDVLCTFKIKKESLNLKMGVLKTSDNVQIMIMKPNPSQEPPASSKSPNQDLKDMDLLCTFKTKIGSQTLGYGCIKDQWPYPNQDQDDKPQSITSSILKIPESGLNGHSCSLQLQNKQRAKIWTMGVPKISDNILIKIKMPNSSQEPPAFHKAHSP